MKLELKHFIGYLPYNLSFLIDGIICDLEGIDLYIKNTIIAERVNYDFFKIKPILWSFSDYKKFSEIVLEMTDYEISMVDDNPDMITRLSYDVIKLMYKNHIDIYGLINHGLAIDINTLKK